MSLLTDKRFRDKPGTHKTSLSRIVGVSVVEPTEVREELVPVHERLTRISVGRVKMVFELYGVWLRYRQPTNVEMG